MQQYSFPPCDLPPGSPVVTYSRVSPGPRQDIISQDDYLLSYIQHYRLNRIYQFRDVAQSGSSVAGRDDLAEMIRFLTSPAAPKIAAVIFCNTSRMARDMDDAQQVSMTLRQHGYRIIYIQNPLPAGSVGRLVEAAYFFSDQTFLEQLRANVKRGLKSVRQLTGPDGKPYGFYAGRIPFGFLTEKVDTGIVKNNGEPRILSRIYPNPDIAPKILKAFQLREQGLSYRRIEKELKLFGVDFDNATVEKQTEYTNLYKGLFRRTIYKGEFTYNEKVYLVDGQPPPDGVIEQTLRKKNPLTGGHIVKRYWVFTQVYKNFVEPIVPPDLWDAVQQRNYKRPKKGDRWPGLRHVLDGSAKYHIFSGLLYCAHCGAKMYSRAQTYKVSLYRYHICKTRARQGVSACPNRNISALAVEKAVIAHIFGTFLQEDFIFALVDKVNEIISELAGDNSLPELQAKVERLTRRRERLLDLVMDGDELARHRYKSLETELREAQVEIERLVGESWTAKPLSVNRQAVLDELDQIRISLESKDTEAKQNVANILLSRVEIGDRSGSRFANITYKSTILGMVGEDLPTGCYSMKPSLLSSENLLTFTIPIETEE